MILLFYVDDIILIGSSPFVLHNFISWPFHQFAVKDLGNLHFCLCVQVLRNSKAMFFTQQKYVHDLIRKFHMHNATTVRTPCLSATSLTLIVRELLADSFDYSSMVDAL